MRKQQKYFLIVKINKILNTEKIEKSGKNLNKILKIIITKIFKKKVGNNKKKYRRI